MKQMITGKKLPPRREDIPRKFQIMSWEKIQEVIEDCGDVYVREKHGAGKNKLILLPEAFFDLKAITCYGRWAPQNICEQKLQGLGYFIQDKEENHYTIVSHLLQIHTMNRSLLSASQIGEDGDTTGLDFLMYYRNEYLQNEKKFNFDEYGALVNPFLDICGGSEYVLEAHTHPNIGCFLSGPDKALGAARAAKLPVVSLVVDPIRKEMLAATGKNFAETEVIVYDRRSDAQPETKKVGKKRIELSHVPEKLQVNIRPKNSQEEKVDLTESLTPEQLVEVCNSLLRKGVNGKVKCWRFGKKLRINIKMIIERGGFDVSECD